MKRTRAVLVLASFFVSALSGQTVLVDAFPNLRFDLPVDLQNPGDGSNRLFVVEQEGRIRVFENDPGTTESRVFLDLTDRVYYLSGSELGLLGLAFHPQRIQRFFLRQLYGGKSDAERRCTFSGEQRS
ncbi:MAG: hypothetical protein HRF44_09885 [Ignavibacterium sp.]|jgi:hypothetical protein